MLLIGTGGGIVRIMAIVALIITYDIMIIWTLRIFLGKLKRLKMWRK